MAFKGLEPFCLGIMTNCLKLKSILGFAAPQSSGRCIFVIDTNGLIERSLQYAEHCDVRLDIYITT